MVDKHFYTVPKTYSMPQTISHIRSDMENAREHERLLWLPSLVLMIVMYEHSSEINTVHNDNYYRIEKQSLLSFFEKNNLDITTFTNLCAYAERYSALGAQESVHTYNTLLTDYRDNVKMFYQFCRCERI